MEHKSHLSQIRTGAALAVFDVRLGGGLGGVAAGAGGRLEDGDGGLQHKQMFEARPLRW